MLNCIDQRPVFQLVFFSAAYVHLLPNNYMYIVVYYELIGYHYQKILQFSRTAHLLNRLENEQTIRQKR